jgi:hypothetical protein
MLNSTEGAHTETKSTFETEEHPRADAGLLRCGIAVLNWGSATAFALFDRESNAVEQRRAHLPVSL